MSKIQKTNFSHEDIQNMLSAVQGFLNGTEGIFNQYKNEPTLNSIADQELKTFPNEELVIDVHDRGILLMEFAADHFMAFADLFKEPAKSIALWTCVRGLLESSALAIWLLDPKINAHVRIGRCFAFRYDELIEQIKFYRAITDQSQINYLQQQILKVEQKALALGFSRLLKSNGEINGIAQNMPSIIELVRTTLNYEAEYRILSGVAHGYLWVSHQVGFQLIEEVDTEGKISRILIKQPSPDFVLYAASIAIPAFAKLLWYLWQYFGWNLKELVNLLETTYNLLNYNSEARFWNSTSS